MSDIALIGAGKLGTNLGYALRRKGYRIAVISDKSLQAAQESRKLIGQGKITDDNRFAARQGSWVILTVPDDAIDGVAEDLAGADVAWQGKFVFHCSGLLSSGSLTPLEKKGALVASLHPVQSFPQKKPDPGIFADIFFGLEGKTEALELATRVTAQLGGRHFILEARNKPIYHTACSMASNSITTLLDAAIRLLKQAGLTETEASRVLFPLVQGTLQNVKKFDAGRALTGPVTRGDATSVAKHLEALGKDSELRDLYTKIACQSLRIVKKGKMLSAEKIKVLEVLLEDK
jgi:predicted short-subunit dehydrogenase-like oxidoreductase (DUF2520 family)